jgi:hypothetical protein
MKKVFYILLIILFGSCDNSIPNPAVTDDPGEGSKELVLINDNFENQDIIIVGSRGLNLVVSFFDELNNEQREFELIHFSLPVILADDLGNKYDIFGVVVEGPDKGARLQATNSCMGYWLSFSSMFPGLEIYKEATGYDVDLGYKIIPGWLIPKDFVYQGAGYDAIKSIQYPNFIEYNVKDYPDDNFYVKSDDLVLGVKLDDQIRTYPHRILDQHEVINDQIGNHKFSIIYCPLTGTGNVWNRELNGGETTFGVSGFLHTSNIIPFDRSTNSLWSQLQGVSINGSRIKEEIERYSFVETTFETWTQIYDIPFVMSDNTGIDRNYAEYPYGDYKTNNDFLIYPIQFDDNRLSRKERVHGIIINGKAKAYRLSSF